MKDIQKVKLPATLYDMPLGDYERLYNMLNSEDTEGIVFNVLTEYLGVDVMDAVAVKPRSVVTIMNVLRGLMGQKCEHRLHFEIEGVKYGFVPNLDNISYGEWCDLNTLEIKPDNLAAAMAILYRPIIKTKGASYAVEPYNTKKHTAAKISTMPAGVAVGAMLFFYRLGNELLQHTPKYLRAVAAQASKSGTLPKNGAGMAVS